MRWFLYFLAVLLCGAANAQTMGGSSSLVIGSTVISGCTSTTGVLFNNNGVPGCDAGLTKAAGATGQVTSGGNILLSGASYLTSDHAFPSAINLNGSAVGFARLAAPTTLLAAAGDFGNGQAGFFARSASCYWISSQTDASGTIDTGLCRQGAGVLEVSTTSANASGSLLLTNITPSGVIINAGITTDSGQTATATVCEDTTTHQYYFGSGTGGICKGTSGRQFKRDIREIADLGLADVIALTPKRYFNREGIGLDSTRQQVGLIADEVKKVMPDCADDNTVDYLCVSVISLNAMKALAAGMVDIQRLAGQVERQQAEIDALMGAR